MSRIIAQHLLPLQQTVPFVCWAHDNDNDHIQCMQAIHISLTIVTFRQIALANHSRFTKKRNFQETLRSIWLVAQKWQEFHERSSSFQCRNSLITSPTYVMIKLSLDVHFEWFKCNSSKYHITKEQIEPFRIHLLSCLVNQSTHSLTSVP